MKRRRKEKIILVIRTLYRNEKKCSVTKTMGCILCLMIDKGG